MEVTMKLGYLQNLRTGRIVGECVCKADSFWLRFQGLLGRTSLAPGEGLWLMPCQQVHMLGMHFAVSVWFLDNQGQVCELIDELLPWKISPYIREAQSVIEFPVGWGNLTNTLLGDKLNWHESCSDG
jgi:uncharacterized protein